MAGKCPGQSARNWTFSDIFTARCPHCGREMEFFRDDMRLPCPSCGGAVENPRRREGCAAWCGHAGRCRSPYGQSNS